MMRPIAVTCTVILVPLWTAAQAPHANRAPQIPLREGLTIVTAVNSRDADFESIKIARSDAAGIQLTYSTELPVDQADSPLTSMFSGDCLERLKAQDPKGRVARGSVVRVVHRADLESAREYRWWFDICSTGEDYPGSTALGVSSSLLRELIDHGQTRLNVPANGPANAFANLIGGLLGADASKDLGAAAMQSGTLTRVEQAPVPFKVIVNDEPVELRAVHARGVFGDDNAEFWFLDDVANPLSLKFAMGEKGLQVVRLSYPPEATSTSNGAPANAAAPAANGDAARLGRQLATSGRAVVYGIYFDFASDRLKPESDTVLAEIATVLQQNPGWSLGVEGHTDSIGGDPYNLDLSKRRAAAVKQALVTRYKVDGARLQTAGYGASRPKDTNATLEGRARNRRVELARL